MLSSLASLLGHLPGVGATVGIVGGTVGIISGAAGFARRRLRLVVSVTENNDAHSSWHTVTIANRSDLALSLNGFVLSWFITTPLGRLELNRAFEPEDEPTVTTLPPHGVLTFDIQDDGPGDDVWRQAQPIAKRPSAYLRIYVIIPARGGGRWLPVRVSKWRDDSLRERLLNRLYNVNQRTGLS